VRRAGLFAWLGVLGPPFAWALQHVAGYAVGLADCPDNTRGPGWSVPVDALTIAIGGVTALVVAACGLAAVAAWRVTRDADESDAPPAGRIHFLAVIGMTITPLFLAMIVMSSAGAIVANGCAQAAPPAGPPVVTVQQGAGLFAANCARCHGPDGRGITNSGDPSLRGPSLHGVGAEAVDFYLRTGYMPLGDARDQPVRTRPRFSESEVRALIGYVASLGGGPAVPTPDPASGSVAEGRELFTEHCSGCHQVVAEGGVMPGAKAPPLKAATPQQIAEAVRIGPYVMPKFSENDISDSELNSIIAYVQYTKDPQDEGGWGISHLGPFPEGMITWLLAIPLLLGVCLVIGRRVRS
jgi:ubiquinol-cytochrome c reductase cytochrome c subunit